MKCAAGLVLEAHSTGVASGDVVVGGVEVGRAQRARATALHGRTGNAGSGRGWCGKN